MANMINSLNFGDNIYPFTLPYGVCSTAASTAEKTVTVDNFSLETGAIVYVGKDSHIDKNYRHKAHMEPNRYDDQPFNKILQNNHQ